MVNEAQFEKFVADKRSFFANIKTLEDAKNRAYDKNHHYGFVATNEKLLTEEFNLLFNRLRKEETNQDIFWFYSYYCCIMLQNYHLAYGQKTKANDYLKLKIQIKKRCANGVYPKEKPNDDSFITFLAKKLIAGLVELVRLPMHPSKIRDYISFANINRIYWIFCRLSLTKTFLLACDWNWLDKLETLLSKKIDVDNIISNWEIPSEFFKFLSVGFYVARFIINAGMILKHVCYPSENEKHLSWKKRFSNEIYKRHGDLINDLVWGPGNLITNYNQFFHIAAPFAGWIVVGFLFFDLGLIIWRRHLAEKEYLIKRLQLTKDLEFYQNLLRIMPNLTMMTEENLRNLIKERAMYEEHCRLLNGQILDISVKWQAKDATYWFNSSAALLLIVGFSASMVFSSPVMILASYLICVFAVSIYLSEGAYNNYKEKEFYLRHAELENTNQPQALENYQIARNDFYLTMAKNVILPGLVIATFAICWQAALVLAAVYLCYQLYCAYSNFSASKNISDPVDKEEYLEEQEQSLCFG
ncbi:MAG: hypothetical protein H0U57_09975 [Tatlockia sp.]|nr:hypothetical protein [Tatlockia sp.]